MRNTIGLTTRTVAILLLCAGALVLTGCPGKEAESADDEVRVTTTSDEFRAVAKSLMEPCNLPAEFGRCGCYLDGILTSCDLVSRCLEIGFCEVAEADAGTSVTSSSEVYTAAVREFQQVCRLSAEFGRCTCLLDGIETSCDFVRRCLRLGFCQVVATG